MVFTGLTASRETAKKSSLRAENLTDFNRWSYKKLITKIFFIKNRTERSSPVFSICILKDGSEDRFA